MEFFERLAKHQTPAGLLKYGYVMKNDEGAAVGAVFMISSTVRTRTATTIRGICA
jgi:hypothetical protein